MQTYQVADVKVHAVEGSQDAKKINLPRGFLYGLDCETSTFNSFAPDFKLRLVQIASEDEAYVFRMDDPWQIEFVTSLLSDVDTSFTSYTDADTMFIWNGLGVDISHRNLDGRMLATLASPEDKLGGVDLKTIHVKYCKVNWLKNAQSDLEEEFKRIYAAQFPEIKRPTIADVSSYGWNNIDLANPIYVKYAGLDAIAARRLVPILIKAAKVPFNLLKMETWLDAQASRMRMRGMKVDRKAMELLYHEKKAACDFHEEEFGKLVWEPIFRGRGKNKIMIEKPISPRSGKKVARYLYDMGADFTGFPLTEKGLELFEEGKLSVEDEVAGVYASLGKQNKELVEKLHVELEAEKAIEHLFGFKESVYTVTKLEEIAKVIDVNDIVHPVLRPCGTVTGRSSSSGPNTQNYSRENTEMREIYVPQEGYTLLGADFAQIEVRVAAALSQDELLISLLKGGLSFHEENMRATGLNKDKAKILAFSSLYGAGPKSIAKQTGLTYDEARKSWEAFWDNYPGIKEYREQVSREHPEIRTISNRRIPVPYDWKNHKYRGYVNLNYKIQSAARELAMASWWRFVHSPGVEDCYVWAFVHDEIIVEAPTHKAQFVLDTLINAMTMDFMGVPIIAEGGVHYNKEGKNCWTKL